MAIQVHFANLHCNSTDDASTDEPYLIWRNGTQDKRIWGPQEMEEGNTKATWRNK